MTAVIESSSIGANPGPNVKRCAADESSISPDSGNWSPGRTMRSLDSSSVVIEVMAELIYVCVCGYWLLFVCFGGVRCAGVGGDKEK